MNDSLIEDILEGLLGSVGITVGVISLLLNLKIAEVPIVFVFPMFMSAIVISVVLFSYKIYRGKLCIVSLSILSLLSFRWYVTVSQILVDNLPEYTLVPIALIIISLTIGLSVIALIQAFDFVPAEERAEVKL